MRVTSILLTVGLALFANAQSSTAGGNPPSTTQDSAAAAASSAQAEMLRCLNACKPGDVTCQAHCIAVPSPSDQQANDTNNCVSACPLGKGTEADNNAYHDCVSGCIAKNYYTTAGTPQPTGGAGSSSGSNNGNGNSASGNSNGNDQSSTGTSGNRPSQTSSGTAAATSTGGAALIGASSGIIGAVGFVAVVMAL